MSAIKDSMNSETREKLESFKSDEETIPQWKVYDKYYAIPEMDKEFTETALHHCATKLSQHAGRLSEAMRTVEMALASIRMYSTKADQLYERYKTIIKEEIDESNELVKDVQIPSK